jgi:hypothetical protein
VARGKEARMTMLLQLLGFAALAAAMHATPRPLRLRDGSRTRRAARLAGAAVLLLSGIAALHDRPIGFAILDWFGLATISALLVLLVLTAARLSAR